MVEETAGTNKAKQSRSARPKSVYQWAVSDVQKWFIRHCGNSEAIPNTAVEEYTKLLADNDITGRTLLRLTDDSLYRMGIHNNEHRNAIYHEVLKQKLKEDILTTRDLERKYRVYSNS